MIFDPKPNFELKKEDIYTFNEYKIFHQDYRWIVDDQYGWDHEIVNGILNPGIKEYKLNKLGEVLNSTNLRNKNLAV